MITLEQIICDIKSPGVTVIHYMANVQAIIPMLELFDTFVNKTHIREEVAFEKEGIYGYLYTQEKIEDVQNCGIFYALIHHLNISKTNSFLVYQGPDREDIIDISKMYLFESSGIGINYKQVYNIDGELPTPYELAIRNHKLKMIV